MSELKIHLPDQLDERFRKTAMRVHGYGRGSISKAAVEALTKWCNDHESKPTTQPQTSSKEERSLPQQEQDKPPEPKPAENQTTTIAELDNESGAKSPSQN